MLWMYTAHMGIKQGVRQFDRILGPRREQTAKS
jgi:hypothetical protein